MSTNVSPQLLLTSWLDDHHGPAKLTQRQRELLARLEEVNKPKVSAGVGAMQQEVSTTNNDSKQPVNLPINTTKALVDILKPQWKPNEIITMFHDERRKIVQRGDECKSLLGSVDSVLNEILALKNLYLYVSPRTSQLHSECKNIIQERNDLKESYDKINSNLNKQEELRSIFRRMRH